MKGMFEIAGGSVIGRDHVASGRNNQDAFAWHQDETCTIAVVCDGCSESVHSEAGALVSTRLLVGAIRSGLKNPTATNEREQRDVPLVLPRDIDLFLYEVRGSVLRGMDMLARGMSERSGNIESYRSVIADYLLATTVCVIIAPWGTVVCSIGDGYWGVNGELECIGPFPQNEPPYMAYDLLITSGKLQKMPRPLFEIRASVPTDAVRDVLIGTDGVADLVAAASRTLPGKAELVGPFDQFLTDDRYFRNPDAIRRRLTIINRESIRALVPRLVPRSVSEGGSSGGSEGGENGGLVREFGPLRDDTTIVVMRRRKP